MLAFRNTVAWSVIAALMTVGLHSAARAAEPAGPTELKAAHRAGHTFLTFREDAAVAGERYRVYRSAAPITAASLRDAGDRLPGLKTIHGFDGQPDGIWTTDFPSCQLLFDAKTRTTTVNRHLGRSPP